LDSREGRRGTAPIGFDEFDEAPLRSGGMNVEKRYESRRLRVFIVLRRKQLYISSFLRGHLWD